MYFLVSLDIIKLRMMSFAAVGGAGAAHRTTAGGDAQTGAAAKGDAMWKHQAGRIDFEELLWERGGQFTEFAPKARAGNCGFWAASEFHRWAWVRVDRLERRDAWAEAVRVALTAVITRRPFPAAPTAGIMRSSPEDPTVSDEERMRLGAMGWSFSEHQTAQQSGRVGWVVSGTWRGRTIRALDDDRSDAWGTALILASVTST
jgi:hypothetical protein